MFLSASLVIILFLLMVSYPNYYYVKKNKEILKNMYKDDYE